jgi:hypothetical protein
MQWPVRRAALIAQIARCKYFVKAVALKLLVEHYMVCMQRNQIYINLTVIIVLTLTAGCKNNSSISRRDTGSNALFKNYAGNPVFNTGTMQPAWRSIHAANVTVLTPRETGDGNWRLLMRGSGNNSDGYHDNIGAFQQPAETFNPVGEWIEVAANPNLLHGSPGTYDALHVLDAAAGTGHNKEVYLYYMGRNDSNRASINGARSFDGGLTFKKFALNPLKYDVGPNDFVYANDTYYLFYGDAKYNGHGFDEPLQIWLSQSQSPDTLSAAPRYALKVGAPGAFDSYSVNGAKIFKVTEDSRYFMLYQCSAKNFDYPERFHCAYSADLINWVKVTNKRPLFTRGKPGEFDQGAIWTGSVIEHKGALYIYYEGWGSFNNDAAIRDKIYYAGGNSRVGVATCSVSDFLQWAR